MGTGRENEIPAAWRTLARSLGGSFASRTRGILAPELTLLDPAGEPFGRLLMRGTDGADLQAGDMDSKIERVDTARYGMTSGGAELLTSGTRGSATALEIRTPIQAYEARISPLRNAAAARTPENAGAVRISGGLTNRRYQANFDEAALPVAIFLLYHLVMLRGRAFQTRP